MRFFIPLILGLRLFAQTSTYPGAVDTNSSLYVTADNVQSALTAAMASGDTVAVVASGTGFVANMIATVCDTQTSAGKCTSWEHMLITAVSGNQLTVTRGIAGTSAASHAAGKLVSILIDSAHQTALKSAVIAIETALGTNLQNVPVSPIVNASLYNYSAQTPGGSLTASVGASVTLTPCPLGVNGTDTRLRFYLSGGTGTAESVASTGAGTCTSGATTGTVTFTPSNNHSGAWTIRSSHAGIYEAIAANPNKRIYAGGSFVMRDCLSLNPLQSLILQGHGYDYLAQSATVLDFSNVTSGCNAISITPGTGNFVSIVFQDMSILGTGTTSGGDGIYLGSGLVQVRISNVQISGFAKNGVETSGAFEVLIDSNTRIHDNGQYGVAFVNTANQVAIRDSAIQYNSRSDGYANVVITAGGSGTANATVLLQNVHVESAGRNPFTSVTTAYGLQANYTDSLTIQNCYFENEVSNPIWYGVGVNSVTEIGNWINGGAITYGNGGAVTGIRSWGNTFYGAASGRTFVSVDLTKVDIGPDTCLNSSTECTTHPRLLGTVSQLGVSGTLIHFGAPNYIASETGANNAIAGALVDAGGTAVPTANNLCVTVQLAHTLQAGANTFNLNAGGAVAIKSHLNTANNIGTAYAATGRVTLCYSSTIPVWVDMSQ